VADADGGRPTCAVIREDQASGELLGAPSDVTGFRGVLGYAYSLDQSVACQAPADSAGLPCQMSFSLEATRTSQPGSSAD